MEQEPRPNILEEQSVEGWHFAVELYESGTTRAYGEGANERVLFLLGNSQPAIYRRPGEQKFSVSFDINSVRLGEAVQDSLKKMWEVFELAGLKQTRILRASMCPIDKLNEPEDYDIDVSLPAIEIELELLKFSQS